MRRRPLLAGLAALFLVLAPVAAYGTAPPAVDPDAAVADPGDGATGPDDGDLVSFGIAPSGRERPDDRPFIIVSAPPGATIYENVAVINLDSRPLTLDVYTGDFLMAEGGGLAVTTRDQPPTGIGSWIAIQTPASVTVPAQTAETGYGFTVVPLVISIPDNAQPGDHLGGVVAALVSAGEGGVNTPDLELEQRVAARVYIRVDGELAPGLVVRDLRATWDAQSILGNGAATVSYTLENTGNLRMAIEPTVTVSGPFGLLPVSSAGDRVEELLPGGTARLTTVVDGLWPLVHETITVEAVAMAAAGGEDPGLGMVTGSTHLWVVPWLILAVLLLLVLIAVWRIRVARARRKRRRAIAATGRRSRRAVAGTAPEPPAQPQPERVVSG